MRLPRILQLRLRTLVERRRVQAELDEEFQYHLDRQIDENLAAGMSRVEARIAALRSIQDFELRKEECRDMRGWNVLDSLMQDLKYAFRQLRKNQIFATTAILVLALGICASVAIFTFVDSALLKPLPYQNPSQLVAVYESVKMFRDSNLSYLDYVDWNRMNTVFSSLSAYRRSGFAMSTATGPLPVRGAVVSNGFFQTLGVAPILGRDFAANEDQPSAPRTTILSFAGWQRHFAGGNDVLGKTVALEGETYTVIGVLPRDFHFAPTEPAEFWVPLNPKSSCESRRSCHDLFAIGRLKEGVSLAQARANLIAIAKQLEQQYPDSNRDQSASAHELSHSLVGDIRPILLVLLGGAILLLLIAGMNVTSLLLVRSETRQREFAVRNALGAGPRRLYRQFMTEGLVLTALAGILGLAGAHATVRLLLSLIPLDKASRMPFLLDLSIFNARVLSFAAAIGLFVLALFSLTPALRLSLWELRAGLAEGGRGSAGNVWRKLGARLVVVELATAVVLLAGAGLIGKSLYLLMQVDTGIQADHLVTLELTAPKAGYGTDPKIIALERQILSKVSAMPGVKTASLSSQLPVSHNGNTTWFRVIGRPWHGEHNDVPERAVSATHFANIGARLLRGRFFNETDDNTKPRVTIVNQTMVRQYFPNEDPIGKQLSYLSDPPVPIEIVGLIEDIKEGPLDLATPPVMYIPFNQAPDREFYIVARTEQDEKSMLPALTNMIRQIDSSIVISRGSSMRDLITESQSAYIRRSSAWVVGGFATAALLLSVIGLYGVIAYSVSQRTREIGIRMALGAGRSSVYRLVMGEAGWLAAAGIVIGLAGSAAAATLMEGLLFGVTSWDLPTLGLAAATLTIAALFATYIPARRAGAVNPVEALRAD